MSDNSSVAASKFAPRASSIEVLARRAQTFLWELRLGIWTTGGGGVEDEEHVGYGTVMFRLIFAILDRLQLQPDDVFLDVGCGRGRVVCCAALRPISEVIGVEIMPDLAHIAAKNVRYMRSRRAAKVSVVQCAAQDFDYSRATAIYMFHPFGPKTLTEVLSRIRDSLEVRKHTLRLAYLNPIHEDVIESAGWMERFDYWPPECLPEHKRSVSFWRATDAGSTASSF